MRSMVEKVQTRTRAAHLCRRKRDGCHGSCASHAHFTHLVHGTEQATAQAWGAPGSMGSQTEVEEKAQMRGLGVHLVPARGIWPARAPIGMSARGRPATRAPLCSQHSRGHTAKVLQHVALGTTHRHFSMYLSVPCNDCGPSGKRQQSFTFESLV